MMIEKKGFANRVNMECKKKNGVQDYMKNSGKTKKSQMAFADTQKRTRGVGVGIGVSWDAHDFYDELFLKTWNESQLDKQPN